MITSIGSVGMPPFYSKNTMTAFQKILNDELSFPDYLSPVAKYLPLCFGSHTVGLFTPIHLCWPQSIFVGPDPSLLAPIHLCRPRSIFVGPDPSLAPSLCLISKASHSTLRELSFPEFAGRCCHNCWIATLHRGQNSMRSRHRHPRIRLQPRPA